MSFFDLSSLELALVLFAVVLGCTLLGSFVGRKLSKHADSLREPFGVLQAALLGLVALILAFGMTMAVGRYDARRTAVVDDANAIGTTYLRAQTLREPVRTRSLDLLTRYTDDVIVYSNAVPGTRPYRDAIARSEGRQRELWPLRRVVNRFGFPSLEIANKLWQRLFGFAKHYVIGAGELLQRRSYIRSSNDYSLPRRVAKRHDLLERLFLDQHCAGEDHIGPLDVSRL